MEISPTIHKAIEIIKISIMVLAIKLVSKEMYRKSPNVYTPFGELGVDIEINGCKGFLGCESMAEDICVYGPILFDDFVFNIIKNGPPPTKFVTIKP